MKSRKSRRQITSKQDTQKRDRHLAHQPAENIVTAWAKPRGGMDDLDDLLDCEQDLFEEIPADQGISRFSPLSMPVSPY